MIFWPNWIAKEQADRLFELAIEDIPWRQDCIEIFARQVAVPRLQNWFADRADSSYTYSGICLQAIKFPQWMAEIVASVEQQTGFPFNRALLNYYRDGRDSVDWHADNEAELGPDPVIASLSLGVERVFQLRHNLTGEKQTLSLPHGSLLLMGSQVQRFYQHRIAKVEGLKQGRVNFTFRYMDDGAQC